MRRKSGSLALLAFFFSSLALARESQVENCFELGLRGDLRKLLLAQDRVREFVRENQDYQSVSTAENQDFIDRSEHQSDPRHLYMNVELSPLKELNDTVFKEKSFPTAAANAYKKIFFRELSKHPRLQKGLVRYSDYKTVRLEFSDNSSLTLNEATSLAEAVARDYTEQIHNLGLSPLYMDSKGLTKDPSTWHIAGFGSSADEARVATIFSTENYDGNATVSPGVFAEMLPKLEESLAHTRAQLQILTHASEIAANGEAHGLFARTSGGALVPSVDAIDLLRKTQPDNPENRLKFLELANKTFSLQLDKLPGGLTHEAQAPWIKAIFDFFYFSEAKFSPGIYSAERMSLHGIDAPYGKIVVDFRGLGSRKIFTTMEAIADSPKTGVKETLQAARSNLSRDQIYFRDQKAQMQKIARDTFGPDTDVRFSGDECSIILKSPLKSHEEALFYRGIQQDPRTSKIRSVMSSPLPPGVTQKDESIFIGEAEALEKDLRMSLMGQIDLKTLNQIHFAFGISRYDAQFPTLHLRSVGKISDADLKLIQSALKDLLNSKSSVFKLDPYLFHFGNIYDTAVTPQ
jgi:hypothetical protein